MAVKIPYTLEPGIIEGYVTKAEYVLGSFIVVDTKEDLKNLPTSVFVNKTPVYVKEESQIFIYDSQDSAFKPTTEYLTEIPVATSDILGGIKLGFQSDKNKIALEVDEESRAFITIPAALQYKAGDGLNLIDDTFSIKDEGIVTNMLSNEAVTSDKIKSVDVKKLSQEVGDSLILQCETE